MGAAASGLEPRPWEDRLTGEIRRQRYGLTPWIPGRPSNPLLPPQEVLEQLLDVRTGTTNVNGAQVFWTTVTPRALGQVGRVLVCHHGYCDHFGWLPLNFMLVHALKHNAACIGFDMPGFGRTDGLFAHVKDWDEFVSFALTFHRTFTIPQINNWKTTLGKNSLKVFGHGESMGGGLLFSICLREPELFDGAIFVSPMLEIASEMRPHPIVETIFKYVLVPMLPTWPITPSADLGDLCYECKEDAEPAGCSPFGSNGAPIRLQTGFSMGLVACDMIQNSLKNFTTPFVCVHAADDKVTAPGSSVKFYELAQSADKSLKLVEGAWHAECFHGGSTPAKAKAISDSFEFVGQWLTKRS